MRFHIIKLNILLFYSSVVLILSVSITFFMKSVITFNNANIKTNYTIIIDAGHGGVDPGAIGVNDILEKDINLSISLILKDMLIANGFNVITTRESDVDLSDSKHKSISKMKTSDLKNRLSIFNKYEDALVLSIHQNKFSSSKNSGAQMFYGTINPESKILAEHLQNSFKQIQPDNTRLTKKITDSVYIIHRAKNPAVLVECGFISNPSDAELLSTIDYQQKVAFTIFTGIISYYQST